MKQPTAKQLETYKAFKVLSDTDELMYARVYDTLEVWYDHSVNDDGGFEFSHWIMTHSALIKKAMEKPIFDAACYVTYKV